MLVVIDQQLDMVFVVVLNWQIKNVFNVKSVVGKKVINVGYYVWMVVNGEFQNYVVMSCVLYGLFFYYFSICCIWWYYWVNFFFGINAYMDQCWVRVIDDFL